MLVVANLTGALGRLLPNVRTIPHRVPPGETGIRSPLVVVNALKLATLVVLLEWTSMLTSSVLTQRLGKTNPRVCLLAH